MKGNPDGLRSLAKYSKLPIERIDYRPDADAGVIDSIDRGILFLMAFWSGPSVTAFKKLTRRPGSRFRHVLKKRNVEQFIGLLPDWNELSIGLNVIQLAPGERNCDGWHRPGVVAVCAWAIDQAIEVCGWYYREHRKIFEHLGVPCTELRLRSNRCLRNCDSEPS